MSLENPSQKIDNTFIEQFPHLSYLSKKQQEHFLVLHVHNEKQEKVDRKTEESLLKEIYGTKIKNIESGRHAPYHEGIDKELDIIHVRSIQEKAKRVKRAVTNITDFVPVIGSIKMILEGLKGKQYGTEKEITGLGRFIHTTSGIVFLALDLTGVGAILSEVGKGVIKIGERALVRSAEETLAREVVEKEATKLVVRGEKRIDEKEKVVTA